jgi:glycosyltransferase involved in cell wall biosynthesis
MTLRLLTNLPELSQADNANDFSITPLKSPSRIGEWLALLKGMKQHDMALINCAAPELIKVSFVRWLLFGRCAQIVSLDTVLPIPKTNTLKQRLKLAVVRWLFKQPTLFIEYFRRTEGYTQHYGIPAEKFSYVPFKVNGLEMIQQIKSTDQGYIFCGGNTRRDFNTLIEASKHIDYPVRIVTMGDGEITKYGSALSTNNLPSNVEIVRHDGDRKSFLEHIAGATLVVLPVLKGNISATGISVYLSSMALGKCVIISSGPAVDDVVPTDAAITVPPEDIATLKSAITTTLSDPNLREQTAAAGKTYALSLGGEENLYLNVLHQLKNLNSAKAE